jgi:dTDP-4-dehydrorhamnose 3,5-epimerase
MDRIDNSILIDGVRVTPLRQILDERGGVYHVIKAGSPAFSGFGEAYFSKINSGVVKAWKFHKEMVQNFSVPFGKLKLVIIDHRLDSPTFGVINEFFLDPVENYRLITIPSRLWYGFTCISEDYCLLLNVASLEHNPEESVNLPLENDEVTYTWKTDGNC